jgi:FHA domain/FhaA, N-terminal domain
MRALSRVERFIERLVERPSALIFHTPLRPVQVLRRLERAMESDRPAGHDGLVADRFAIRLHPIDLAALQPLDAVAAELASGLLTFARSHGYTLRDRPRVAIAPGEDVEVGDVAVTATVSPVSSTAGPAADQAASPEGGPPTRVYQVPVARTPEAHLEITEPGRPRRRVTLGGGPLRVGRSADCELVLRDPRVSRRHARLQGRDGLLVLTDLGSTNGTFVNGYRISEVVLGEGDRIEMGQTTLLVSTDGASGGGSAG